jgi:hypothetical protein
MNFFYFFVVDSPRFTAAMRAQINVLSMKRFDKNTSKWIQMVPGRTTALTSCTMHASDGSSPYRYFLLSPTLATQYKNDIDHAVDEINKAIKPHKYVLHLSPKDRASVNVTLTFTGQPSGKVRTSGENDDFIKNLFNITKCGLEQVHDNEGNSFLETFGPVDRHFYAEGIKNEIRKEGIQNVSVKVTP